MTIPDALRFFVRQWKIIVASVLVCLVVAAGYLFLVPTVYQSQASIVVSSRAGAVYSLANTVIMNDELGDYSASANVNQTTRTVYVTVVGPDREGCTATCEMLVDELIEAVDKMYPGVRYTVPDQVSESVKAKGKAKTLIAAVLVGLFGSIAIISAREIRRRRSLDTA